MTSTVATRLKHIQRTFVVTRSSLFLSPNSRPHGSSYAITVKLLNLCTLRDRRHQSEAFWGGAGGSKSRLFSVEVLDLSSSQSDFIIFYVNP